MKKTMCSTYMIFIIWFVLILLTVLYSRYVYYIPASVTGGIMGFILVFWIGKCKPHWLKFRNSL